MDRAAPPRPELEHDAALDALRDLAEVLEQAAGDYRSLAQRCRELAVEKERVPAWRDVVEAEDRPLIVEAVTTLRDRVTDASARFRRSQARALADEGLSHQRIATMYGVTRQRVAALLGDRPGDDQQQAEQQ
ncbi:hypothetical protein EV189_0157 [Motilibacter rhizosphaerae]|uniref:Homeodomain-like domain-containing protein n=1 Tax=Motilibacter rhizosphaerae TaxID=598652 RepID=A0A4Q7NUT1_9ACTN|nr:hypothetical protein [Motilibacter rhizosphaerae]RZS90927.1 hypothetical protein EV189_0157 [Motilibacter rhizosphaerae]